MCVLILIVEDIRTKEQIFMVLCSHVRKSGCWYICTQLGTLHSLSAKLHVRTLHSFQ